MPRRPAWHGDPPQGPEEARRRLLEHARDCLERLGPRAGLTDVARAAGVTRQTVYRYVDDADDLFRSAAALGQGGFLERLRAHVDRQEGVPERIIECLVYAIRELPRDPHLGALTPDHELFALDYLMSLGFVQAELRRLCADGPTLPEDRVDDLAELMLRLLHSFLTSPGPARSEVERRRLLRGWLLPVIAGER